MHGAGRPVVLGAKFYLLLSWWCRSNFFEETQVKIIRNFGLGDMDNAELMYL